MLSAILATPIVGVIILFFINEESEKGAEWIKRVTFMTTLITFFISMII